VIEFATTSETVQMFVRDAEGRLRLKVEYYFAETDTPLTTAGPQMAAAIRGLADELDASGWMPRACE
jgi:hypothetical protein